TFTPFTCTSYSEALPPESREIFHVRPFESPPRARSAFFRISEAGGALAGAAFFFGLASTADGEISSMVSKKAVNRMGFSSALYHTGLPFLRKGMPLPDTGDSRLLPGAGCD